MRKEITSSGTIYYYNDLNQFHREDGPAIEHADGDKHWFRNDQIHREDGPACEYADGKKEYWLLGIQYATEKDYLKQLKLKAFW